MAQDESDVVAGDLEAPGFEVSAHFLARVSGAAYDRDAPELRRLLKDLHPADLADVMEQLPGDALRAVLRLIGPELEPEWLADLGEDKREEVLDLLPADYVARALGQLDTDDAAAVAADLDEEKLQAALAATDKETRLAVEQGLAAEEDTAGRLMQREFFAVGEDWQVGRVIDLARDQPEDFPDRFFEIYVVDPLYQPIGAVPLSTLLKSRRDVPIAEIMTPPQALITPEMDQEEVAFLFQKYHLASAPVVDADGRLAGMVTMDDIVHVIQEENQEDLLKLSGVSEASQADTVVRTVSARIPWLLVNLCTALVASTVIGAFDGSIEKLVALAVLMPIVASLGGNAGTQALAVAVRAIASRDLTGGTLLRYVGREAFSAFLNGLMIGAILALVAGLWFQSSGIALAIGLAVLINLTVAGLIGILAPVTLRRLGADPAIASSVFVTFITDCVGFFSFLSLATLILL
jgi:magnesium transporter